MRRTALVLAFALVTSPAWAICKRYTHPTTGSRFEQGAPQVLICDLEAELPTIDVRAGDLAYTKDSAKLMKRTATAWVEVGAGGGGGAPTTATYITQTPDAGLSAEQALSLLGSGLALNTTGTGVLSIYAGTSCTNQFPRSLNASGAATCASVADADLASNYSGIGACGANTWASTLNDNGAPTCTQPAFTNISGTVTDAQLANNYSGVGACTNQFPRTLNDNAAPTCADVAPADFASQTQNTVLAAPNGAPGDPTFRALVDADVPDTITLTNLTQVTTRAIADTTGTLAVGRGGTNLTTATDDNVMVGNGTTWESKALPNCGEAGTLNYDTATNAFSCLTDSGGGGSFTATEVEIDYGTATPYPTVRTITVVDAAVSATSKIVITQSGNAATGRQADETEMDFLVCNAKPGSGSFQLTCLSVQGPVTGKYKIIYAVG